MIAVTVVCALLSLSPMTVFAYSSGQAASVVLGQKNFTSSTQGAAKKGMYEPTGLAFDSSGDLWVADCANNRTLEFAPPFTNGEAASLVLGQPNFQTTIGVTTQTGMYCPWGLAFDPSGNLWVSDALNNRVLEFAPPFTNDEAASIVLGQPNFNSNASALTRTGMYEPLGITFDPSGNLWVVDSENGRVLEFARGSGFTNGQPASVVLGQPNFTTFSDYGGPTGLYYPWAVASDHSGDLWVADWGNNRVVEFEPGIIGPGFTNGQPASLVLGQPSLSSYGLPHTTQTGMYAPEGIAVDSSGNVWVADQGNSRVLEFVSPSTNGQAASIVLGQSSFTTSTPATTSTGMQYPEGVTEDSSGNVWVADTQNNRVLEFRSTTSTTVNCVPSAVLINKPTTCTATVTDTGGFASTPTGKVTFISRPMIDLGTFNPTTCMLSGTGITASCSVEYTPTTGSGTRTIGAIYAGDSSHLGSRGSFALKVAA